MGGKPPAVKVYQIEAVPNWQRRTPPALWRIHATWNKTPERAAYFITDVRTAQELTEGFEATKTRFIKLAHTYMEKDGIEWTDQLEPHQKRAVIEKRDLDKLAESLSAFIGTSEVFPTLDPDEQARLKEQCELIKVLRDSASLGARITAFKS